MKAGELRKERVTIENANRLDYVQQVQCGAGMWMPLFARSTAGATQGSGDVGWWAARARCFDALEGRVAVTVVGLGARRSTTGGDYLATSSAVFEGSQDAVYSTHD